MSKTTLTEENLADLLPVYYKRLFPHELIFNWLCYGDPKISHRREISFNLLGDIYLRYQSFTKAEEFAQALVKRFPLKIDIGAVYKESLQKGSCTSTKTPMEREIVFDIDMTDYDDVRTCCSGADVCEKCWKFLIIACKILNAALREDFGFEHLLWVFSGRRGIHCWIADNNARRMNDSIRSAVAEYLSLIKGGITTRKVKLPQRLHYSVKRAINIIDKYFEDAIIVGQDLLGSNERVASFLNDIVEGDLKSDFKEAMLNVKTSKERWQVFENTFHRLNREQKIPKSLKSMIEEAKIYYAYPRLDINVTKGMAHLLKSPFCVHPKTGKISVPFQAETVDNFHPNSVPTIIQLLDEINAYDAKVKEREQGKEIVQPSKNTPGKCFKIKDYKKTSLFKYVIEFKNFLRGTLSADSKEKAVENGSVMEF